MHMYESSEALVKELESAIQQETNESRKSQYVSVLQSQKNISANLKSLGDANSNGQQSQAQAQQNQSQQAYNTEFASEQHMNTAQHTSETQAQAKQEAQRQAKQQAQAKQQQNDSQDKA
jgi:hypothetical protein